MTLFIPARNFITISTAPETLAGIGWPAVNLAPNGVAAAMVNAHDLPEGCPQVRAVWSSPVTSTGSVQLTLGWYYAAAGLNLDVDGARKPTVTVAQPEANVMHETALGGIPGRASEMAYVAIGIIRGDDTVDGPVHLLGVRVG